MELRTERLKREQKQKQRKNNLISVAWLLFIVELALLGYLGFVLWNNGVFSSSNWLYIGLFIVGLVVCIQLGWLLSKKLKKTLIAIIVVLIGALGFGTYRFSQFVGLFQQLNSTQHISEITMSVVVLKDSNINKIEDVSKLAVEAPLSLDNENITALVNDISTKKNITLNVSAVSSYHQAYEDLKNGKTKVIILSNTYESLLAQEDANVSNTIKKIYEFKVRKETSVRRPVTTNQKTDVFNIYISGIDTYGPITEVSRSDVNIIATVNTATKQILLTSTPRDSYVKIADGGKNQYDKLTHAGIYGIDSSIHTLENLYGIQLDYFVRINFTTFMNLIDIVGGVDVDNEYYFKSTTVVNKEFPAGKLHLNAEYALAYVRERYNLKDGDVGRAAHQEEVITQVLKKLLSTKLLTESEAIIQQVAASAQTDMDLNTIFVALNKLTSTSNPFDIHSQALEVEGQIGLKSYAMPDSLLWMGVVQEDSLEKMKENINAIMSGKKVSTMKDDNQTDSSTSTDRN